VSAYGDELAAAELRAREAHQAMEAWLSRPLDAPDVPGAVLENHAKTLRESREMLRRLLSEHGVRDDIAAALEKSEFYHRSLGLSIKDKPEPLDDDGEEAP
jgi:hypothetical protein